MPSKTAAGALTDIRREIMLARGFIAGMTFTQFHRDRRTVYAVIRCLEIISEASRRLPKDVKARHPHIPWTNVAGAGNVYRHDYEEVADRMVWQTVQDSLGSLLGAVEFELRSNSDVYRLFRKAILGEKQVTCVYQGRSREVCPLVLGHSSGKEKVLAFQFAGETGTGRLPPGGAWKCMFLAEVREARLRDGLWREGRSHKRMQVCVSDVDLDINVHVRKLRR